jgi:F-type H+-transporting ATPase subunit gamma
MPASVRAIQGRIENIDNIRQITKAMNAIAMTKVTRTKRRLAPMRPYLAELESVLSSLLSQKRKGVPAHPLTVENGSPDTAVLVLNADRGLCGRFKGELNHRAEEVLDRLGGRGRLLIGGEKARLFFSRRPVEVVGTYTHLYEDPTREVARRITADLTALYREGKVGRIVLVYMRFLSDLVQRVAVEDLLPVRAPLRTEEDDEVILEPSLGDLLQVAVSLYLEERVLAALLETKTSEHAIRRQAMKSATDNADDLLVLLHRSFNKARQQSITREIADIMGGAEALRQLS